MNGNDERSLRFTQDLETLRNLGQRYARAADARDYDAMAMLFHPDATVDGLRGTAAVDDYLEAMRTAPSAYEKSMHFFSDPLVKFDPEADTAELDTYAVVHQIGAHAEGGGNATLGMRYFDTVARRDEEWRITYRRTELIWMTNS